MDRADSMKNDLNRVENPERFSGFSATVEVDSELIRRPIGIFDSGLGGLTAVNAFVKTLPKESFIYVGDTARIPYGEKDIETVSLYGRQIMQFLQKKNIKAAIVACGTLSSNVIQTLRKEFNIPIIDVVNPGVEACLRLPNLKRVGVIATEATIKSGVFPKILREKNSAIEVEAKACPLFVPLIEEGLAEHPLSRCIANAYFDDWQKNPIDALILGCTHYPLISSAIQKTLPQTTLVDISVATLEVAFKILEEKSLLNKTGEVVKEFYSSGDTDKFNQLANQITGMAVDAKKVFWD